jgi:hypothetical protein
VVSALEMEYSSPMQSTKLSSLFDLMGMSRFLKRERGTKRQVGQGQCVGINCFLGQLVVAKGPLANYIGKLIVERIVSLRDFICLKQLVFSFTN